jgi:hypothetical protein
MAQPDDLPLLDNPPADLAKACTQATIVIPWEIDGKVRQDKRWGSPAWRRSYGRRSRVEGLFGIWQGTGSGTVNRGWVRITGLVNHSIMLTIAAMASNLEALWRWLKLHPNKPVDSLIILPDEDTEFEEVPRVTPGASDAPPAPN